jgi:hypothetical protein
MTRSVGCCKDFPEAGFDGTYIISNCWLRYMLDVAMYIESAQNVVLYAYSYAMQATISSSWIAAWEDVISQGLFLPWI